MFDIAATCIVLTALLANANQRLARLPTAIGVMVIALALSLGMLTSGATPTVGFAVKR